jgi:hypothetical protein
VQPGNLGGAGDDSVGEEAEQMAAGGADCAGDLVHSDGVDAHRMRETNRGIARRLALNRLASTIPIPRRLACPTSARLLSTGEG